MKKLIVWLNSRGGKFVNPEYEKIWNRALLIACVVGAIMGFTLGFWPADEFNIKTRAQFAFMLIGIFVMGVCLGGAITSVAVDRLKKDKKNDKIPTV
jgi:Mg/Co/Ni transporter MgtE